MNEQSTFDIADTEPLHRRRRSKRALHFTSSTEASTPKLNGRAKSKTCSGTIQLFDIEFDDSYDGSTLQSRTSYMSSIPLHSQPSAKDNSIDMSETHKNESFETFSSLIDRRKN